MPSTLLVDKELASGFQPLLLAVVTFSDGTILRAATHAVTYGGNVYLPRILNQEITATAALSEQGIDIPASVTLRLADPDYYIWSNFEKLHGFKGAELQLTSVMADMQAGTFTSDSRRIFTGVCREPGGKMPAHNGKELSAGFFSKLGIADIQLPATKIQKTCPNNFPSTLAERQDGADNAFSEFYRCGYSWDASGANARGNSNGGVAFTTCNKTKEHCVARGMYTVDGAARQTGRFSGVQWAGPTGQLVREYVTGKWSEVNGGANEARNGDSVPLLYGRAWTDPLILTYAPDGNFLKMEALICGGEVDYIHDVVVNDVKIPHTFDDTLFPAVPAGIRNASEASKGGWWKTTNKGTRNGSPTNDAGFNDSSGAPQGDPYGSMCVIEIVVPRKVADSGSQPRVRVLAERGSSNPATQLSSVLQDWCTWQTAEINTSSASDCAAVAAATIPYTDNFGGASTRARFTSSLYIRQRESAAEIVRGLRNCGRMLLSTDSSGLLYFRTKRTLADQQPSAVSGSNYATAIASKTAAGVVTNGYAAYKFDTSNILEVPVVSLLSAGNRYSLTFQNADNNNSIDAYNPIDSEDIGRVGREIPGSFTVKGVNNYDQFQRLVATHTAEQFRGNWRADTGGTLSFEFVLSVKALHLQIGDLCLLDHVVLGVSNQLVRITKIQPSTNFETARIAASWHDDNWYVDTYGQLGQPRFKPAHRNRLLRPPFGWLPYGAQPAVGDPMYARQAWGFGLIPEFAIAADGSGIARVNIAGRQIVNETVAKPLPPFVPLTGTTASTGGTITGGRTWYAAISAKNANGSLSPLSAIVSTYIGTGTATNTLTIGSLSWDPGTSGYALYAGSDPMKLSLQDENSGTPSSITITAMYEARWGAPDGEFHFYRIRRRRVEHSGVFGAQVLSVGASTIQIATATPFTVNQWAGRDVSLIGRRATTGSLPIANFRVLSNTGDTLTLAGGSPSPVALGVAVGDVVAMRSLPTYGTDGTGQYIEDALWVNAFAPTGLTVDGEAGRIIRVIAGLGEGQTATVKSNTATRIYADFQAPLDATSRYIVEESAWTISDTAPVANADGGADMAASVSLPNEVGQTWVIQVLTVDGGGDECLDAAAPIREVYLPGMAATVRIVSVSADYTVDPFDGIIEIDTTGGPVTVTLPDAAAYAGRTYTLVLVAGTNEATIDALGSDLIDGAAQYKLYQIWDGVTITSRG